MRWQEDAEGLLKQAPFFVRGRVRRAVEEFVAARGRGVVTARDLLEAKEALRDRLSRTKKGFEVEGCFECERALVRSGQAIRRVEEVLEKSGLEALLRQKAGGDLKHHHQFRVAFSSCPNSCSQGQIKDVAFIGVVEPVVAEGCTRCGACEGRCEERAIEVLDRGPEVDRGRCLGCGDCIAVCPEGALKPGKRGYRVLVGGKLGRHPRLASELLPFSPEEEAPHVMEAILKLYKDLNLRGERLGGIIQRVGWEEFRELFWHAFQGPSGSLL